MLFTFKDRNFFEFFMIFVSLEILDNFIFLLFFFLDLSLHFMVLFCLWHNMLISGFTFVYPIFHNFNWSLLWILSFNRRSAHNSSLDLPGLFIRDMWIGVIIVMSVLHGTFSADMSFFPIDVMSLMESHRFVNLAVVISYGSWIVHQLIKFHS